MRDTLISVGGVSKKFCRRLRYSLLYGSFDVARVMLMMQARTDVLRPGEFWAVHDVSLDLKRGETLGLIGPNGSGKTTLLRLVHGVFPPDTGRIELRGRMASLISVGAGFHPLMTGRENVYLNGSIMGMTKKEIDRKFDSIVDFAGVGDFLDAPVKFYSSGMYVRLGFSIAIHSQPDILLVDEILAVGDLDFQRKCARELDRLLEQGTSMIIVSHNPYLIERMCRRVAVMDGGSIQELGDPSEVIPIYFERVNASIKSGAAAPAMLPPGSRPGTGEIRVTRVETLDALGNPASQIQSGEGITIRVHYEVFGHPTDPNIAMSILNSQDILVVSAEATRERKKLLQQDHGVVNCRLRALPLMPGGYTIQVRLAADALIDFVEAAAHFTVLSTPEVLYVSGNKGVVTVQAEWQSGPA